MATKAIQADLVSTKLISHWEQVGQKMAALAVEIPDSNYEFRPAEGVRSVGEVLRHVAFWNRYVADSARGKKGDDSANELPKEKFGTKRQIVDALKKSLSEAADALKEHDGGLSPETADMLVSFIEHNSEHYGQLAVYARLNGIVPPVSRG
jgi:uncharacterized damage-inducible protein DinB